MQHMILALELYYDNKQILKTYADFLILVNILYYEYNFCISFFP